MKAKLKIETLKLRLFISGASTNSLKAVVNTKALCEKYLPGNYELEVIDVHQQGEQVIQEQIIALPLLVKYFPLPVKKIIGDMSNTQKVLAALGKSIEASND